MNWRCPGCDVVLNRDAAIKHTRHGGLCNTMFPLRNSADHDKEERVDKLQNKENKEKRVDDIASADEIKLKKIEAYKAEMKDLDDDELNELLESLRAEIDELKNPKKETQEATRKKYDVLMLEPYTNNSSIGDSLLMKMGSTEDNSKGDSSGDSLLKSLGSSD